MDVVLNFLEYARKFGKILFVVEGKNDKKALLALGLENVLDISGRRLSDIANYICSSNFRQIAILTDFDKEGNEKHKLLVKLLEINVVKINSQLRKKFISIFKARKVEDIASLLNLA